MLACVIYCARVGRRQGGLVASSRPVQAARAPLVCLLAALRGAQGSGSNPRISSFSSPYNGPVAAGRLPQLRGKSREDHDIEALQMAGCRVECSLRIAQGFTSTRALNSPRGNGRAAALSSSLFCAGPGRVRRSASKPLGAASGAQGPSCFALRLTPLEGRRLWGEDGLLGPLFLNSLTRRARKPRAAVSI
jgi:hypothetical protein